MQIRRRDLRQKKQIIADNEYSSDENISSELQNMILNPQQTQTSQTSQSSISPEMATNIQIAENTFRGLAQEGRGILKYIEDFNYKLQKSLSIFQNQEQLYTKLDQKKTMLDSIAGQIYAMVFDLENFDLLPIYEQEQLTSESMPGDSEDENGISELIDEDREETDEINDLGDDLDELEDIDEDLEDTGEEQPQGGFEESEDEEETEEEPEEESEEE